MPLLLTHPTFHLHDTTPHHPESPARLTAIEDLLHSAALTDRCTPLDPRPATDDDLRRIHHDTLLGLLAEADQAAQHQRVFLDPDTVMTARSWEAARLAAGGVIDAARAVVRGDDTAAFCLVRPPGHHATPDRAMGFCLVNHIALAAADVLESSPTDTPVARVAVIDFDVHHGNGTQDAFYHDPRLLYVSTHQYPHYPGTGRLDETGAGDGAGANCNLPLPPGCGDAEYLACFDEVILPLVRRHRPQLLLVSAGFDAHWRDPLADERLGGPGYRAIAERIAALAAEVQAPMLWMLEGGYDLEAIAWAARHCLEVLLGDPASDDPVGPDPNPSPPDIGALLAQARTRHRLD